MLMKLQVLTPPDEVEWEWRVLDLIDCSNYQWDKELVATVFHRFDADAILRIPLSHSYVSDVLLWLHNKNGRYSVKSGYHISRLLLKEARCEGESSAPVSNSYVWDKIWKLQVPNKIKVFGWRACQNILPTRANLAPRRIIEDDSCPICLRHSESVIHALWGVWNGSGCVGWVFNPITKKLEWPTRHYAAICRLDAQALRG
ncbi:hypothetical protein SO802_021530 [Lithocarpus litseifolius]|uniref:Reverse transcriptase zinc-binding domain-containing protein n=1 Tax=Lithocarpus litseifolius TaxID=425828 RepID=A0AAW2CJI2_9ROSI